VLATQNSVNREDLGVATATVSFFRSVGGSVGVALFGAVFNNHLAANLAAAGGAAQSAGSSSGVSLQSIRALPAAAQVIYKTAFSDALSSVFLLAVPVVLLAFALTWLLREVPLRKAPTPDAAAEALAADPDPALGAALAASEV